MHAGATPTYDASTNTSNLRVPRAPKPKLPPDFLTTVNKLRVTMPLMKYLGQDA